ncbi:OsmC family peroxiredoxin [Georgenia sp. SUBG003]|uniref:OsmC family peroxiredoxin n=1 Tax=Georgenia sp. SUBG003 TaxID=1497974 RepID=UPI0004D45A94|nr:peroxiredoxin [Georgenia sp. SUBG003]
MPKPLTSKATNTWQGNLFQGSGTTRLESSGLATFDVDWKARTEEHGGRTNPEELIAAAHSSCFSMAFSNELDSNGTPPTELRTTAEVTFVAGEGITGIQLTCEARIDGISEEDFQRIAEAAKTGCPVSQALRATPIELTAKLV